MRRQRSAKIVATVGPASNSPEKLDALFRAGVDLFRLNFSHGTHEDHAKVYKALRELEEMGGGQIVENAGGKRTLYRVLAGPYSTNAEAQDMLGKLGNIGINGAKVVKG